MKPSSRLAVGALLLFLTVVLRAQPLPPIHPDSRVVGSNAPVNVNPQPLPPRY